MCKHEPHEIFPRRSDLPETATDQQKIDLFIKMFRHPVDYVICGKCGKTGHYIKSRRGGIRWHSESGSHMPDVFSIAEECWNMTGKKIPYTIPTNG
jgi:hypothetical protein